MQTPKHPQFHIVILAEGLLLVRAGPDERADAPQWRALQDRFPDFKTSLGPADLEDILDILFAEWPSLAWREAEIRLWALGEAPQFDLEAGMA
jgi:hypothetical protein